MNRRRFLAAAGSGVAALTAGCVGGSGGLIRAPSAVRGAETAREAYPGYDWDRLDGIDPFPASDIELREGRFSPPVTAMRPGSELPFVNRAGRRHTVTIPALGLDEELDPGGRIVVGIERSGSYGYVSTAGPPRMAGRVIVTDAISELNQFNP